MRLFGRFVGVFDEEIEGSTTPPATDEKFKYAKIQQDHLRRYFVLLELMRQQLLGFRLAEGDFVTYIPLPKA